MQLGLSLQLPYTHKQHYKPVYNERRFHHTWYIGKTGQGKSTALINCAVQDILNGDGIAFFDPHGDAVEQILKHIPPEKAENVVLFDPSDRRFPVGFNPLHAVPLHEIPFVASALVDTFKSVWGYTDVATPQLDQYLYNGVAALLEVPDGTLLGLKYLLTSEKYRKKVLSYVTDPVIRDFWATDFEAMMPDREKRVSTLSTLNKIGALVADPKVRNVIGQPRSTVDFDEVIETGKCLLVSLPQGKLGLQKSSMIGALALAQLHLTALHRRGDRPFHVYLDEAHRFGTSTLEEMLSGIRKFSVSLVIAHQYLDQLTPSLQAALFGTVGTIVSFRVGIHDAEIIGKEMGIPADDLTGLNPYNAWARTEEVLKLSMPHLDFPEINNERELRKQSRLRFGTKRHKIETRLKKFIEGTLEDK